MRIAATGGSGYTNKTDQVGDDEVDFDAASGTLRIRVGSGANATQGGTLSTQDAAVTVKFVLRIADTASGPVADLYGNGGFGPASGYGLRASLTLLEAMVWKGLTIRLSGYYELFNYTFDLGKTLVDQTPGDVATGRDARHLAAGASDTYFGGVVQIGYQY